MGWIPVVFAQKAIRLCGPAESAAFKDLLQQAPEQRMRDGDFFDLLEHIARTVSDGRSVPLRVGASMRCDDYGAFGLSFKSAPDLRGSYRRVERYGRVVTTISNFRLVNGEETSLFEVIPALPDRPGVRLTNELALSAAVALSREVSQQGFELRAVHLSQAEPDVLEPFEEHFRCPIRFGSTRDALEVANHQLHAPNRLGDDAISRFLDAHLDGALKEVTGTGMIVRQLKAEISSALSEGIPKLETLAPRLAVSPRTLQRRLAEDGMNFQGLVKDVQYALARKLLQASECRLSEVAFLTGFSDQSSFGRAFKRWSGHSPRAFRESARLGG